MDGGRKKEKKTNKNAKDWMPGESYRRRLGSLLLNLCYVFRPKKKKKYLYSHACQVRVTVGDSGLCYCTCVTYFEKKKKEEKKLTGQHCVTRSKHTKRTLSLVQQS